MPNVNSQKISVALVGGGVSSVAAALTFPASFSVDIFERDDRLLKKLMKTGNGKANIYSQNICRDSYNNPDFIANHPSMLDTVKAFYQNIGVLTYEDEEGRGYPYSRSARSLATYLVNHLPQNVRVLLNTPVTQIKVDKNQVLVNGINYDYILIATGSSAYDPKTSLDNDNFDLFRDLGIKLTPLYPTSGPLAVDDNLRMIENEKVKATLTISENNRIITKESGEILFKKDNLSGIASFIAHSRLTWDYRATKASKYQASLNLIDGYEQAVETLLSSRPLDHDVFKGIVSDPLASYLALRMSKTIKKSELMSLLTNLKFRVSHDFVLSQDRGQLMNGGVEISQINTHNFSLNICNNIYLGGEVLDIDGVSGGYNLMFALYSGIKAAQDIVDKRCQ